MKILYVNGGLLDKGGISSFIMNYFRNINHEEFVIDILTQGMGENLYIDEIKQEGGKVFQIPSKSSNIFVNLTELKRIMKFGGYDIVHAHADSGNGFILKIAKECGIPVRISHSHSLSVYSDKKISVIFSNIQKKMIKKYATDFWGCSEAACLWLYGNKIKFRVIKNAININTFCFDIRKRNSIREQLGINSKMALCQVGHLSAIKNQIYSLKILKELLRENNNYALYFIGNGAMENKLKELTEQYGIEHNVFFLGEKENVADYLNAMDIMLQPSLVEGLGMTVVEAQINHLPVIASKGIPKETKISSELITYLDIDDNSVQAWCETIRDYLKIKRETRKAIVEKSDYDILNEVKKIEKYYKELFTIHKQMDKEKKR